MPGGSPGTPLSTLEPTENTPHYFCLKVVTYTSIITIMLPLIFIDAVTLFQRIEIYRQFTANLPPICRQ